MFSGKPSDGLGLNATAERDESRPKWFGLSIRFRRGPTMVIIAAALLWAGLVAAWWWL
jgi:hypothetical protein